MEQFKSIRIIEHANKTTVSVQLTGGNSTVTLAKAMSPQSVAHCLRHLALLLEQGAKQRAIKRETPDGNGIDS